MGRILTVCRSNLGEEHSTISRGHFFPTDYLPTKRTKVKTRTTIGDVVRYIKKGQNSSTDQNLHSKGEGDIRRLLRTNVQPRGESSCGNVVEGTMWQRRKSERGKSTERVRPGDEKTRCRNVALS